MVSCRSPRFASSNSQLFAARRRIFRGNDLDGCKVLLREAGAVGLLCVVAPILASVVLFVQAHELRSPSVGPSAKNASFRENWPQFRGPNGSGVGEARDLPIEFGPAKNVLWKTAVLPGVSSPVLAGDQLLLTAFKGSSCFVICLNRQTGLEL